jgi:hypothetical protein
MTRLPQQQQWQLLLLLLLVLPLGLRMSKLATPPSPQGPDAGTDVLHPQLIPLQMLLLPLLLSSLVAVVVTSQPRQPWCLPPLLLLLHTTYTGGECLSWVQCHGMSQSHRVVGCWQLLSHLSARRALVAATQAPVAAHARSATMHTVSCCKCTCTG